VTQTTLTTNWLEMPELISLLVLVAMTNSLLEPATIF
jgi:hypothetical protein